jgi:TPR repeat protein
MDRVGWMNQLGQGVTRNIPTAFEWFSKAAKQGNANA